MHRFRICGYAPMLSLAVLALLLAAAMPALAGDSKPRVVPVDEHAFGKSYEEWSAAWWQWVFALPAIPPDGHPHPLFDTTGKDCDEGQEGKVWFLGGIITVGSASAEGVVRKCTVPNGKALFFPILNTEQDNVDGDPNNDVDRAELTRRCLDSMANPQRLLVKIDGVTLQRPHSFAIEPYPFRYDVTPEDSLYDFFGVPWPGELDNEGAVSCGYYVMLQPLAKGTHTILIAATTADGSFKFDVTYKLTVSKSREKGR
jgi:hypothetical protein